MDKEAAIKFFNEKAANWDSGETPKSHFRIAAQMEKTELKKGDVIADIACGTGVLYPYFVNAGAKEVLCLDISSGMTAELKKKYPRAHAVTADFETAALPENCFDKVFLFNALPHFDDKPLVFERAYKMLKKGGAFFVFHSLSRAELAEVHGRKAAVKKDLIPSDEEMKSLYKNAGFVNCAAGETEHGFFSKGYK